ncbi:hypothetical protein [Massilia eurypsychrophila]|uniref:hypothetical protein n=1 Tax=Massilia eurypsychrophila TaxID=1485217 RepID=UPI0027D90C7A|nr:hypothetical protein [Massilia eurypsychrophila]
MAGRLAGRLWLHPRATTAALLLGIFSFGLPLLAPGSSTFALAMPVAASIVLDMGVAANLVLGQRAIFALGAMRSRLNGLFFALFFAGGALGSALAAGCMLATAGKQRWRWVPRCRRWHCCIRRANISAGRESPAWRVHCNSARGRI